MKPSIGRIVHYVLSQQDVESIQSNRQRMAELLQISAGQIGNSVSVGRVVPAQIVCVWDVSTGLINGQATLDGFDTHWLLSRHMDESKTPGTWHWPEREGKPGDSITRMDAELTLESLHAPHRLMMEALEQRTLELCRFIEGLGASSELTTASVQASNIFQIIAHTNRLELLPPHLAEWLNQK